VTGLWRGAFPALAFEVVHRLSAAEILGEFEALRGEMRAASAVLPGLADLGSRGVSTAGMLEWLREVHSGVGFMIGRLHAMRGQKVNPENTRGESDA